MEQQLQELLDRKACEDVLMRYGRTLDWLDQSGQEECFWPDATIDYGFFRGTGVMVQVHGERAKKRMLWPEGYTGHSHLSIPN